MNRSSPIRDRIRRGSACFLIPAVLLFGLGSALEVFHPVEESAHEVDACHRVDETRAAVHAHDTPAFHHDHHFCAHSNALAYVAALRMAFQSAGVFVAVASELADRPTTSVLAVLDRGPPFLL